MSKLKAILFDVDGTLADTERFGHRVAFNEAFAEAGLDWHWDEELYGQLLRITGGKQRMRYFLDSFYQGTKPAENDLDKLIVTLHERKNTVYQRLLAEGRIPLREGVERLIAEARASGVVVGIATTTTPENVYALLKSTLGAESLEWFGVIAAGDMVPRLKPAPDVYEYCLEKLGFAAEECIAVEDSANGVRSAFAAGIATLVTTNAYTLADDFSGAAFVVDGLGEAGSPVRVMYPEAATLARVDIALLQGVVS